MIPLFRSRLLYPALMILLVGLACGQSASPFPSPTYTPEASIFESGRTAYGFFPTPSEVSLDSVFAIYKAMGQHADVSLVQENIPWMDFATGVNVESQKITDMKNAQTLALANNLDSIYVVDPLNGFNRREFSGLPVEWSGANFSTPEVRTAYLNFTLRILREFKPRYLGLASEINTYAEAHPEDFKNFISLYRETYAAIKAESPETKVFVTFQWEQMNSIAGFDTSGVPYKIKWEQVDIFEPQLDLWVISSYPFIAFKSGSDIPADYYAPLLTRTNKPLAVAEGGFVSRETRNIPGKPQDQVDYLNAIHTQLGDRLDFWIYLLLDDLNENSYGSFFRKQGMGKGDIETFGFFVNVGLREKDGTPKPALQTWDSFRAGTP
jgi:hypothetical protein